MSDVANLFPASPFDAAGAGAGAVPDLGSVLPTGQGGGVGAGLPSFPGGDAGYGGPVPSGVADTSTPFLPYSASATRSFDYQPVGQAAPVSTSTPAPAAIPAGGPTTAASAFDNLPQFPTTSEPGYGVGAPATPADTGTPGFFKRLAESIGGFKKDYGPLFELGSLGIAGGGLLKQLLQPGGTEALNPLQQEQLNMMRQQQQTAQQYMTGQITPEMQQNIQNQTQANIQQIKAKYAQMGMSGSTAEAQEIAGAEARGTAMLGQAQTQMIQTGAQMLGLPTQTIAKLSAQQLAQDKEFSDALAAFVGSLAGTPAK
jgi:hypothetical protein